MSQLIVWALNIHQLHTGTNWSSIGKDTSLPIMYFNACSIVPKFGELCPIVETISLTLCPLWSLGSVKKFQIMRLVHIPGYNPFCRDRSGHNGGVLLYTRSHLTVKMLPCPHNSLEILPVVINRITVVYRPPRSPNSSFDSLCRFVAFMNIHWFSHFVLIGDFHVSTYNYNICCIIELVVS